jgi:hypothetical protein
VASIYYHKQNMERIVKWFWFLKSLIDAVSWNRKSNRKFTKKPSPKSDSQFEINSMSIKSPWFNRWIWSWAFYSLR